ncbi:hypothetical protein [Pseudalkalibacillus berkeleyi]|uniref:O-antigen polymerase n=1 Tax=Pseudalkalibacillus berkeleyi TaxID=1069813 RepID=A0ABS9H2S0_9BACL|nr:hypothetical protein [Pseudalkalibacillus berkeleyi]MCF6139249.1 hypothetical protein [Pseudalkalibacillus berkeleyi]
MLELSGEYKGLVIMLIFILIPVLFLKTINKYLKAVIYVYFTVVTVVFIQGREKIHDKYYDVPVPDLYWDKNSKWVGDVSYYYFIPVAILFSYIFYKWFQSTKSPLSKVVWTITFIIVICLFFIFTFIFNFGYGYRP